MNYPNNNRGTYMTWNYVGLYEQYIDYEQFLNIGDDDTYVTLRATYDIEDGYGYVAIFAITDGGSREILQFDFPKKMTAEEFTALTGYQFTT
jgi:hypothetical protein